MIVIIVATMTLWIIHHNTSQYNDDNEHRSFPFCHQHPNPSFLLEHQALGYLKHHRRIDDVMIPSTVWQGGIHGVLYMAVRNEQLANVRETIRSLEDRFNHRYHYPWILLCPEGFSDSFISYTKHLASGPIYYGKVDLQAFITPPWVQHRVFLKKMTSWSNPKEHLDFTFHQLMRYQSGIFYHHPLFKSVDYIWKIDPGTSFSCNDMDDPFKTMQDNNKTYGFTVTQRQPQGDVSGKHIWKLTESFIKHHHHLSILPSNKTIMQSIMERYRGNDDSEDNDHGYSTCHFGSSIELMDMRFLKSAAYQYFFKYMDQTGAFFYEKFTDVAFRTLAIALFSNTADIQFLNEIGLEGNHHCPLDMDHSKKCACDYHGPDVFQPDSCTIQLLSQIDPNAIKNVTRFIRSRMDHP
ncbi:nucleotide-diphospho-sugar transferase [Halteromyces radiatus]|uniref:nucleotide-diphospho-sugar transferase n=1 Tax=Halteromyces radiatus TaxID=101107 RepID=UPI002220018A|nr:nucleotide-diphospho-sugar transferase [Halteromyces radiatus]KAI8081377.1 nucleotide-diphospho-sugar transferase [Halteromyces radiatus]